MDKKYCAAPWRGLHINPRGDVKTCCAGDPNMLGNLNDHGITEILFGERMKEIRRTIKQGMLHPEYCYNCIQSERYGVSERDWHNSVNDDFDCTAALDDDHVPVIVDVRWNNTCNLSCNYCGDSCSSRWASLKQRPFKSGTRPYYKSVCEYLQQHTNSIKEVALVGGEPLLLPENEQLLEVIPQDCIVTLITNASVDLKNNKIFKALSQRSRVGWSLSFDNIEQQFEYVRHGAKWQLLLENIEQIQRLMSRQGHWGGIHAVYNVYNATSLTRLTGFARERGLSIHWQTLYQPDYLDPMRLGPELKKISFEHVQDLLDSGQCLPAESNFFQNILNNANGHDDLRKQFESHIIEIETNYHRDQLGKFAELWPELVPFLDKHAFATA